MRQRADRREWSRRVWAWRRSGKTAKEFAAETGLNAKTLLWWSTTLRGERGARRAAGARRGLKPRALERLEQLPIVELSGGDVSDGRFELELATGRRLRIPAGFDAEALSRLLAVLK